MKFIPFIDKSRAVDFTTSTTLARLLQQEYKINPAPPQFSAKGIMNAIGEALEEENVVLVGLLINTILN